MSGMIPRWWPSDAVGIALDPTTTPRPTGTHRTDAASFLGMCTPTDSRERFGSLPLLAREANHARANGDVAPQVMNDCPIFRGVTLTFTGHVVSRGHGNHARAAGMHRYLWVASRG